MLWFRMKLLESLQSCKNALRAYHTVAPFLKEFHRNVSGSISTGFIDVVRLTIKICLDYNKYYR